MHAISHTAAHMCSARQFKSADVPSNGSRLFNCILDPPCRYSCWSKCARARQSVSYGTTRLNLSIDCTVKDAIYTRYNPRIMRLYGDRRVMIASAVARDLSDIYGLKRNCLTYTHHHQSAICTNC